MLMAVKAKRENMNLDNKTDREKNTNKVKAKIIIIK